MSATLSRRILRFNFDPFWFVHPSRMAELGVTDLIADGGEPLRLELCSEALRTLGLSGRWCFNFDWLPNRLVLLSSSEVEWVLPQLAILALPEFRALVVRRDEREWMKSFPASNSEGASAAGDVFREGGEFRAAAGVGRDIKASLRRYGAGLWLALGRGLGEAAGARMRLMLDPALEVPAVKLEDAQGKMLYRAFASCVTALPDTLPEPMSGRGWAWLR